MNKYATNNKFKILTAFVVLFACVLLIFTLFGCDNTAFQDQSFKDKNYVEVTALRIGNADIRLSSSGETSTYQLNVEVVPANATNRKLNYYIPSEYHKYVTVSSNGLLQAIEVSDGILIPLTVSSTTNPKAKLSLTVVVENVSVEKMYFEQESLSLLYNGEDAKVTLNYKPYHAIDGRNATFTSLNESVARVSQKGVVTPIGVGNTRIKATSTTRTGKLLEAFVPVVVSYSKGQYQLDVSGVARYSQVIGDFSPINFTLLILGENVDPNPEIEWYIDTERVLGLSDAVQYSHFPTATTQLTYYVYAHVTAYGQETIVLRSQPISIFKPFYGIELEYENLSQVYDSYTYGEEVKFHLTTGDVSSTIKQYNWYLMQNDGTDKRVYVGSTLPSDRDLTRRMNVSGDYVMVAEAVDNNGNLINSVQFEFSSERLTEKDVLVVHPTLINDGLPPDSFHWFIVKCNDDGSFDEDNKVLYKDTGLNEDFYYTLNKGVYRIIVTASIAGVGATVIENGEYVPYEYVSEPIRVYGETEKDLPQANDLLGTGTENLEFAIKNYCNIEGACIEGMYYNDDYAVYISWDNVAGVGAYIVELTYADGTVKIIDSANETDDAVFGNNYCYLYGSIASLNDEFTVRIKQKGSLYSMRYYYGIENEQGIGDETHVLKFDESAYPHFEAIVLNETGTGKTTTAINTYLCNVKQLEKLLEYVVLYAPVGGDVIIKDNILHNNVLCDTFTFSVYLGFDINNLSNKYINDNLLEEYVEIYGETSGKYHLLLESAFNAVNSRQNYTYTINDYTDNGFNVSIYLPTARRIDVIPSANPVSISTTRSLNYSSNAIGSIAYTFAIDCKDQIPAYTSDDIVFACENGYNPIPTGSDELSMLYIKIKRTVASVIDDGMTDYQKALALHDYLAHNVAYDNDTMDNYVGEEESYVSCYHLEGVFNYKTAVCAGFAKAYTVMCNIVGIPCIYVRGEKDGVMHAWNKILIENKWYVVDVTKDNEEVDDKRGASYIHFLISDESYFEITGYNETNDTPSALYDYVNHECVYVVTDVEDILQILEKATESGTYAVNIKFAESAFADGDSVVEFLENANFTNQIVYVDSSAITSSGRNRVVIFEITVI